MTELAQSSFRGGAETAAARLGGELRSVRERLGWRLPDLAQSLRIRQVYLEAIECGEVGRLPGSTYALGFVRTYANALGLSGEEMARRFKEEAQVAPSRQELHFPVPVPQRGVPAGALILLGLLVLACAYGGWFYVSEQRPARVETVPPIPEKFAPSTPPSPQVATILPNAAPPSGPPPTQAPAPEGQVPSTASAPSLGTTPVPASGATTAAPVAAEPPPDSTTVVSEATLPTAPLPGTPPGTRILIKATADAWVTIKQRGGPPVFNKLMHAGDAFPVPADRPGLTLTTGNAGGTELDVDGEPVAGMGASGMVRRDLALDPDLLKSGPLPPIARGHPRSGPAPQAADQNAG